MNIVRWDSLRDNMAAHQDRMSRMFEGFYGRPQEELARGSWVPAVDIYSNGQHELVLKAELPAMSRDDIGINIENFVLTIKGEKTAPADVRDDQYHHIERRYGSFSRSFSLPQTVDPNRVSAEYKDGVLTVRVPLREEAKPRTIKVDVAA